MIRRYHRLNTIILTLWGLLIAMHSVLAQPTFLEIQYIQGQVEQSFQLFLQLWQEERYFELYDLGKESSRKMMDPEDYATRMVELDWVPIGLDKENPLQMAFQFRTMIYVIATIEFRHKSRSNIRFKKQQRFLLLWENEKWRFDLVQMIRSPFYSPPPSRKPPPKPAEKNPKETAPGKKPDKTAKAPLAETPAPLP
jgi:hypothetical protein